MSTQTQPTPLASANGHRGVTPPPGPSLRQRERRRFGLIAGAVVLVLAAALAVGLAVSRAGGKVSVIVIARPVAAGHRIGATDLTTERMAGDAIPAYAADHASEVIGKVAVVGLVKGEVLNPRMVTTRPATPPGYVVTGVLLKPGQLPARGVTAGDTVTVILLSRESSAAASGSPSVLENSVSVTASSPAADGSGTVVSLLIPKADAARLAQANSGGLVSLAQVPTS